MAEGDIQVQIDEPVDPLAAEADTENEEPPPLEYNDAEANLVEIFLEHPDGIQALKEIGDQVVSDFDDDFESTINYRQIMASIWKLFIGDLPEKEYPFEHAANPHIPILLENISRVVFRAVDEMFKDWYEVFGVLPTGPANADVADVLTIHGNWQIRTIADFKRQMHTALLAFFLIGDVTAHSFFDPVFRTNCHETLTPDEFVTPYMHTSKRPDYGDLPHYTKILNYHRHQLQKMRDTWANVDTVIDKAKPSWSDEPEQVMERAAAETMGIDTETSSAPTYKLLWYEGYLELPNQDHDRFCQVIVDYRTKNVLKLAIHEEADWRDAQRHQQQTAELKAYRQAKLEHDDMMQQYQTAQDLVKGAAADLSVKGEMGPMQAQILSAHMNEPGGMPEPPMPPSWAANPDDPSTVPEPPSMSPILLFSHGVCIESLVGNLGIGFGRIEADLNRAANTALAQFTDSATFANIGAYLVPGNLEWKTEPEVYPGAFIKMQGLNAEEMKGVIPLVFQPPSQALAKVFELMQALGQSSMQAPEALSGEPGKSGETYRGLSERIEQATKQLSVPTRKFGDFFTQILQNNAKINSVYLPDGEIETIIAQQTTVPPDTQSRFMQVARQGKALYRQGYQVEIRSDLRFTSTAQRIQEADQVVALTVVGAPLEGNLPLRQYALKKSFEARGRRDLIPFLGPMLAPPTTPLGLPPPPPPGALPQGQEPPGGAKPPAQIGAAKPNMPPHQPATPGQPAIQ